MAKYEILADGLTEKQKELLATKIDEAIEKGRFHACEECPCDRLCAYYGKCGRTTPAPA